MTGSKSNFTNYQDEFLLSNFADFSNRQLANSEILKGKSEMQIAGHALKYLGLYKSTDTLSQSYSEAFKGRKMSEEAKMKISKALKGNKNNEGRKFSQETKDKISRILKEKIKNGEIEILSGKNSPYVDHNGLQKMREIAKLKDGKCLSIEYINNKTKMKFKCKEGHIWKAVPLHIKRNRWCPYCLYKNQEDCRTLFEELFNTRFLKKRPKWLLSPKGYRMELDGYNEELKIAFEYQGEQHYRFIPYFHGGTLEELQERDELKRKLCEKNDILLIEIPYYIKSEDRKDFIMRGVFQ